MHNNYYVSLRKNDNIKNGYKNYFVLHVLQKYTGSKLNFKSLRKNKELILSYSVL